MCPPKTMFKIGVVIVIALAVVWFAIPGTHASFFAIVPFVLVAICPLTMLIGMRAVHRADRGNATQRSDVRSDRHSRT